MRLYLPEAWTDDADRRDGAGIPASVAFQTKWQIALEQVDAVLAAGIRPSCVATDAAYGDCSDFREGLAERGLHYSVGVSSTLKVFAKPPRFVDPKPNSFGRPHTTRRLARNSPKPKTVAEVAASVPKSSWKKGV